jgi:hypothetical protein
MKTLMGLVLSVAVNAALLGSLQSNVSLPTPRGEVTISQIQVADETPAPAFAGMTTAPLRDAYAQLNDGAHDAKFPL